MTITQQLNQQESYEAISYAPLETLKSLTESCLQEADAEVTTAPFASLIMARVRETVDAETFNLGEVLVTICEITLDGEPGWGMVLGQDHERALCAALLDAAARNRSDVRAKLAAELSTVREARRARWNTVQPTRVEFEEMA